MTTHIPRRACRQRAPDRCAAFGIVILLLMLAGCVSPPPLSAPSSPPAPSLPAPLPPASSLPVPSVPAPDAAQPPIVAAPQVLETQTGLASFYHASLDGNKTASGITFDNGAMMAAHPTHPFGTRVRVTNLEKSVQPVEVRITDRGPTASGRAEGIIIDLSGAAAKQLDMVAAGRVRVKLEVLEWGEQETE